MKHGLCEPVAKACTQNSECSYMQGSCINDVCGCPEKDYFRNENGNCTKCTETVGKLTYQEECNRCGNRFYENGYCKLCTSTKYVNDTGTKCIVCPTNGSIFKPLNETGCNNCNTAEHPYQMVGNICKPKVPCTINDDCGQYRFCVDGTCGCPEGYFQNKNGNCTDCGPDGPNGKETFDEECAKCNGARHMVDGKCNRVQEMKGILFFFLIFCSKFDIMDPFLILS